jgi:S-formylglutathione hydrolase FrmB
MSHPISCNGGRRRRDKGTHAWPYWERGLQEALPILLKALGR